MNLEVSKEAVEKIQEAAFLLSCASSEKGLVLAKEAALEAVEKISTCSKCGAPEGHLHDKGCSALTEQAVLEDDGPIGRQDRQEAMNRAARQALDRTDMGQRIAGIAYSLEPGLPRAVLSDRITLCAPISHEDIARGYAEINIDHRRFAEALAEELLVQNPHLREGD
jgi:hypothetical protein